MRGAQTEDGSSLSTVAIWLERDRSGLFRILKSLGYPTRPSRPSAARQRQAVVEAIAAIDTYSRAELRAQLFELLNRHQQLLPLA